MPYSSQPRRIASDLNSLALSMCSAFGNPITSQLTSRPRSAIQRSFGRHACVNARETEWTEGASKVTDIPMTARVATSIARVNHGRAIALRVSESTTIASTGVWSICITAKGSATS